MARIDVNVVNPFLSAVVETLGTMAQVRAAPGRPYLKEGRAARGDVSGIIGFTGAVRGSMAVTFPERCAMAVVGNMLGERQPGVNETVIDAVGELTNIISGRARQGLQLVGLNLEASIPEVVTGHEHCIMHCGGPVLCLAFTTLYGEVVVEVAFGESEDGERTGSALLEREAPAT